MDTWKSTLQAETIAIARAHPEASHRGGNGLLGWAHGDYVCASGQASQRQAVMWSRSSVTMAPALPISSAGNLTLAPNELSIALQRNQCLDGSSSSTQRCNASIFSTKRKNYYSAEMLSKIALHEPKRARRIMTNRKSAIRSKEKRMHHMFELEKKAQNLLNEKARLSHELTFQEKSKSALIFERNDLKLRMQTIELKAKLQDALTDALRAEIQRLQEKSSQETVHGYMDGNILPNDAQHFLYRFDVSSIEGSGS